MLVPFLESIARSPIAGSVCIARSQTVGVTFGTLRGLVEPASAARTATLLDASVAVAGTA